MSFREYLRRRRITDTPNGDFTLDCNVDPHFPDASTWPEVEEYLLQRGACVEAIEAGRNVWQQYKRRVAKLAADRLSQG